MFDMMSIKNISQYIELSYYEHISSLYVDVLGHTKPVHA